MKHARAARDEAAVGWDASPISTARLCAELWAQIKDEDWSLVSGDNSVSGWPHRLWTMDKHYHYIGDRRRLWRRLRRAGRGRRGARQQEARPPHRGDPERRRSDDSPGVLWTAAKHKIPMLFVMHNNRAYHQEVMHLQRMADRHMRDVDHGA